MIRAKLWFWCWTPVLMLAFAVADAVAGIRRVVRRRQERRVLREWTWTSLRPAADVLTWSRRPRAVVGISAEGPRGRFWMVFVYVSDGRLDMAGWGRRIWDLRR